MKDGDLILKALYLKGSNRELLSDLTYHVTENEVIVIKAGFITDGASTPFGVRNLFPKHGTYSACAVVHDALYHYKGVLPEGWFEGEPMIYSQKRCDQIFKEAMKVLGVSWWRRGTMYNMLRLFGRLSWVRKENQPGR